MWGSTVRCSPFDYEQKGLVMTREQWALLLNADPDEVPRIARLIRIESEVWE